MNLLQMSVSGGIMILIVTAIRALALNRVSKQIFPATWGLILIRLLIPFSWPSSWNVGFLLSAEGAKEPAAVNILPLSLSAGRMTGPETGSFPWVWIWGAGAIFCALYFMIAYLKCRQDFRDSEPVENAFTKNWLKDHKSRRPVTIRQTSRISTPLTYGILRPVILMPKQTSWTETNRLQYIFTHEYIHIRRFDGVTKFLLATALCVHWFNPTVWVLFLLANRDLELSCDEKVLQTFGEEFKSDYALTLIDMAERKNAFSPLCNSFSKNVMKERITSIMKNKKTTVFTLLTVLLLTGSVTTVFAASSVRKTVEQPPVAENPKADHTVVYDTVEVRHYTEDGAPYVFWQRTNNTEKSVSQIMFSMLAFDENGEALYFPWSVMDSSAGWSYDATCIWEPQNLNPGQQADSADGSEEGGWSLGWTFDPFGKDTPELRKLFGKAAYVLCCDRKITFEDGSIWENPDYGNWLETYKGKKTDVSTLQNYYSAEQALP